MITTVALAVVPDLLQILPLLAWIATGSGSLSALSAYSLASPGTEPALPQTVRDLVDHLHCVGHSAIVAGIVTSVVWIFIGRLWIPLLGWWSHIVIDVFTHSAEYYPSPVLYPFSMRGFDGIAWTDPWFMAANYASLLSVGVWLAWSRWSCKRRKK